MTDGDNLLNPEMTLARITFKAKADLAAGEYEISLADYYLNDPLGMTHPVDRIGEDGLPVEVPHNSLAAKITVTVPEETKLVESLIKDIVITDANSATEETVKDAVNAENRFITILAQGASLVENSISNIVLTEKDHFKFDLTVVVDGKELPWTIEIPKLADASSDPNFAIHANGFILESAKGKQLKLEDIIAQVKIASNGKNHPKERIAVNTRDLDRVNEKLTKLKEGLISDSDFIRVTVTFAMSQPANSGTTRMSIAAEGEDSSLSRTIKVPVFIYAGKQLPTKPEVQPSEPEKNTEKDAPIFITRPPQSHGLYLGRNVAKQEGKVDAVKVQAAPRPINVPATGESALPTQLSVLFTVMAIAVLAFRKLRH